MLWVYTGVPFFVHCNNWVPDPRGKDSRWEERQGNKRAGIIPMKLGQKNIIIIILITVIGMRNKKKLAVKLCKVGEPPNLTAFSTHPT